MKNIELSETELELVVDGLLYHLQSVENTMQYIRDNYVEDEGYDILRNKRDSVRHLFHKLNSLKGKGYG